MQTESVLHPVDISVIIPMYNAEAYIRDTIHSILNQEGHGFNIEIIIVDDVSRDRSRDVVRDLGYKNVKLIELEKNGGSANARNVGIRQARGEWIQFVDSDDRIGNDLYKKFEASQKTGINCYVFSLLIQYQNYAIKRTVTEVKDKRGIGYFYAVWNLFIKRDICMEFNQVSRQHEDTCFVFDMMIERELQISLIEDAYYILNRTNDQSKTANFNKKEYLIMYSYLNSRMDKGDDITKMLFLETFVGIVFSKGIPLFMSLGIALKTLIKYYRYLPEVYTNGIRNCVKNKRIPMK